MRRGTNRTLRAATLSLAVALLGASCTGAGTEAATDAEDPTAAATAADAETAPVEGCDGGWVDPEDLTEDRPVARCEPGSPQPRPLPERTSITVTAGTFAGEYVAPLLLADAMGEFEAENLEVRLQQLPSTDAYSPLGRGGDVDVVWAGTEAAFFNAVAQGFDLKQVTGNFFPHPDSRTGLWTSTNGTLSGDDPDLADLAGGSVASGVGTGSVIMYPLSAALGEVGLSLTDLRIETIPFTDMVTALEQGAVDAAWVLDPFWRGLLDVEGSTFITGQPAGEPLGGAIFGPRLLEDEPDVGEAFVRALIRTISTYIPPDYHDDADVVAALAQAQESTPEAITAVPPSTFDWELRAGTSQRVQQAFADLAVLDYDELLPEDQVFDRSFYERVVGR